MNLKWKRHVYTFKPVDYAVDEVKAIMGVKRGTYVRAVICRIGELFNGTVTLAIGDGTGAADGFAATTDITQGTVGLYPGYGTYFSGANGYLYTDDDTIDLTYNYTSVTDQGLATIYIIHCDLE